MRATIAGLAVLAMVGCGDRDQSQREALDTICSRYHDCGAKFMPYQCNGPVYEGALYGSKLADPCIADLMVESTCDQILSDCYATVCGPKQTAYWDARRRCKTIIGSYLPE